MAPHELCGEAFDHVGKIEGALLLCQTGVEDDLEQEIAEFIAQVIEIAARNGVGDLVSLLNCVGGDGLESLLEVPWAAAAGRAQRRHDFEEPGDVTRRGHRKIERFVDETDINAAPRRAPLISDKARYSSNPDRCEGGIRIRDIMEHNLASEARTRST